MPGGRPTLRARLVRRGLVVAVQTLRRRSGGLPDPDGDPAALRAYGLALRAELEAAGERLPVPRSARITAVRAAVPAEWVVDERAEPGSGRVVLHLHGGAYTMGSPRTHRGLAAALSRVSRAPVLVPDYRLAPEHVFPAALDDAEAVYRWLLEHHGADPAGIVVSGDSAGGGLGLALLVRLRDAGLPLPAGYVGISPWTDLAGTGGSVQELAAIDPWLTAGLLRPAAAVYAGDTPLDDPLVSPLYADLAGLPPLLVHVGGHEILRDDARRLVARARAAGVAASVGKFPGLWHVFHVFPGVPEARDALREIGGFIRRCTARVGRVPGGACGPDPV